MTYPFTRQPWFLLTLITLAASLLSIPMLYGQSIRLDESQSIWAAGKSLTGIFLFMAKDVHPPLYLLLLHGWMMFLGSSIIATRTLSLLFFVLTIPFVYLMAKVVSDTKTSLMTVVFFCLSPFIIWFGTETRMYALLTLLTAASHWLYLKLIKSNARQYKFPYFLVSLSGIYTQYFFALLLLAQFVYGFLLARKKQFTGFAMLTGILLGVVVSFLPWILYVARQGFGSSAQPMLTSPTAYNILQTMINFMFGFQTNTLQSVLVSFWPLVVLFFFLIFTNRGNLFSENLGYFLLASFMPVAIIFAASFIRPVFLSRYLIFTIPSLFFLIAWSLVKSRHKVAGAITVFLMVLMGLAVINQGISAQSPASEDYASVNQYLSTAPNYQDIIAVTSPFTIYPIEYNYQGLARLTTIPKWDRYTDISIPAYSNQSFDADLQNLRQIYNRLFVVLSYDQGYEQQIRNFLDTHYHLLDHKDFGQNIEVRVYQLRYD